MPRSAGAPAGATKLGSHDACFRVLDWTSPTALPDFTLAAMIRVAEPHIQRVSDAPTPWLRSRLAEALRDGRLEAYLAPPRAFGAATSSLGTAQSSAPPPPPPEEKKTWVGIQLVDEDGEPVPYKRYVIELPDGSKREGMLDDKGIARINDVDPGTCQVSFPQFDASEWKAA